VQQVADDREGNSHAEPDRHEEKPFIDLISQLRQSLNVHSLRFGMMISYGPQLTARHIRSLGDC
jgi:hypothetical protein